MFQVDNAIILAAGTASRFAPLSYEMPKALITVRGEILIERQIKQLQQAGIKSIIIVVGYMKEQFYYLREKYGVSIIENKEYLTRNNNASIYAVKDYLANSYICSSDNYFTENPFEQEVEESYYAAVYSEGETEEWCMTEDEEGYINHVIIGGSHSWYMLGHTFWSNEFSSRFKRILENIYEKPETASLLWESIYRNHLQELKMKIRKYEPGIIFEFDTLDELRKFDTGYIEDSRSKLLKCAANQLNCEERDILNVQAYKDNSNAAAGFSFEYNNNKYAFGYTDKKLRSIN